jgi:hypothetical protein
MIQNASRYHENDSVGTLTWNSRRTPPVLHHPAHKADSRLVHTLHLPRRLRGTAVKQEMDKGHYA